MARYIKSLNYGSVNKIFLTLVNTAKTIQFKGHAHDKSLRYYGDF